MKTAAQEKLEGNPGHRPENKTAPEINTDIPNPPKFLCPIGKRAYHDLVALFGVSGSQVLSREHASYLSYLADAIADFRKYRAEVEKDGVMMETQSGKKPHPLIKYKDEAWKRVERGLKEFGGTAYSSKSVSKILGITTEETREEKKARTRAEASEKAKKLAKNQNHITKVG